MGHRRWVVEEDAAAIADIVERLRDAGALGDGRAFVNGARATAATALAKGDLVEVWDARAATDASLVILHRTSGIVAVDKPAELPTIADHRGATSLTALVARLVGEGSDPHAISRLDVGVSGVVVFATTRDARVELEAATRAGRLEKRYLGIAKGSLPDAGRIDAPVDGKKAGTRFTTLGRARGASLVRLELETGRHHQIREHLASLRAPLFGDRKLRGPTSVTTSDGRVVALGRILLHAVRVVLHVGDAERPPIEIVSPVPDALRDAWATLDGDGAAFEA